MNDKERTIMDCVNRAQLAINDWQCSGEIYYLEQARAELKKRMQDKGVLPPDKPKLNRKKFIDEAREEWNGRSSDCFIWEHYLMDAISYMLCQREGMSSRASLEAVGAAKVLKLAIRLREFSEEVREKGEHEYKLVDQYNYIKDILDA